VSVIDEKMIFIF